MNHTGTLNEPSTETNHCPATRMTSQPNTTGAAKSTKRTANAVLADAAHDVLVAVLGVGSLTLC